MVHVTEDTQPLVVWHYRFGHLNQDLIGKLSKMCTGLHIGAPRTQTVNQQGVSCLKGAQHKTISLYVRPVQDKVLGCEHMDLEGPCLDKDIYDFVISLLSQISNPASCAAFPSFPRRILLVLFVPTRHGLNVKHAAR